MFRLRFVQNDSPRATFALSQDVVSAGDCGNETGVVTFVFGSLELQLHCIGYQEMIFAKHTCLDHGVSTKCLIEHRLSYVILVIVATTKLSQYS